MLFFARSRRRSSRSGSGRFTGQTSLQAPQTLQALGRSASSANCSACISGLNPAANWSIGWCFSPLALSAVATVANLWSFVHGERPAGMREVQEEDNQAPA